MLRKQNLLQKAQTTGLTMSERGELRELELWERDQSNRAKDSLQNSVNTFKDDYDALNRPRHRALENGINFHECLICNKNRNINSVLLHEYNYMKDHPEDFCMKPHIHNDKTFAMMIQRPRIDLDEKKVGVSHG